MSNNKKINILREQIIETEAKVKNETDLTIKAQYIEEEISLREKYTPLLLKKRPLLLTFGIVFAIFWGISLMICLPPFIIRGKKRDINEEKISKLKVELSLIKKQISSQDNSINTKQEPLILEQNKDTSDEIELLKKEIEELKKLTSKTKEPKKATSTRKKSTPKTEEPKKTTSTRKKSAPKTEN